MCTLSRLLSGAAMLLSAFSHAQTADVYKSAPAPSSTATSAPTGVGSTPPGVPGRSGGGVLPAGINPANGPTSGAPASPASVAPASPAPAPSMPPVPAEANVPATSPGPPVTSAPLAAPVPPTPAATSARPASPRPLSVTSAASGGGGSAVVLVPAGAPRIAPQSAKPGIRAPARSKPHARKAHSPGAGY